MARERITEIIKGNLQPVLGDRLIALAAGVRDVGLISEWGAGKQIPQKDQEWRLRLTSKAICVLASESPETIRSWFIGTDSILGNRAPAIVIADVKRGNRRATRNQILRAAKAFLAE